MSGKVIHIDADVHAQAKEHCIKNNIHMSRWIANLIRSAISGPAAEIEDPYKKPRSHQKTKVYKTDVVAKKPIVTLSERETNNPYIAPPFWSERQQ